MIADPDRGVDALPLGPPPDRRRWVDWLLGSGIGLRALYGLAMLPLIPLLIGPEPLLLTLLSGSTVAEVVLGARVRLGEVPWLLAIAASLPVWVLTDWLYWAAGRRWGDRALLLLNGRGDPTKAARRMAQAHRVITRFGAPGVLVAKFLPVPSQLVYAAAGTAGMRLPMFLLLNLLGTAMTATVAITLGFAFGRRAVDLVESFQEYASLTAVGLAVVLVLVLVLRRWRARSVASRGAVPDGVPD